MTRLFGLTALAVGFAVHAASADDKDAKWEVTGLHVTKPRDDAEGWPAQARTGGTSVNVRLAKPGPHFVGFDLSKSKLESFTDDKGTDLNAVTPISSSNGILAGNSSTLSLRALNCPVLGSTKVRIKGRVVVWTGKDSKEIEKKDVPIRSGIELAFGTIKYSNSLSGDDSLSYRGEKPITSMTLLDADGKDISLRFRRDVQPGAAKGAFTASGSAKLKNVKSATVKVAYYDTIEETTVPIDLEVGPGF